MNLKDLKKMRISELTEIGKQLSIEGAAALKKPELIYAILQASQISDQEEVIVQGEGVLEVLPDGYGFLRSPDS
ncbi:MAG: Rho termination factor N-terminal domain-containing protein, partial [Deltaproteobacteria bacterium]|nr:Rho termination factor N-terminal domain-containing protein [Deltaproteobacteria bacterium]